jgi:hypothetical protein
MAATFDGSLPIRAGGLPVYGGAKVQEAGISLGLRANAQGFRREFEEVIGNPPSNDHAAQHMS